MNTEKSAKDYVDAYSVCVSKQNFLCTYSNQISEQQVLVKTNKENDRQIRLKVLKKYPYFCLCEVLGMNLKTCVNYMDLINSKSILI